MFLKFILNHECYLFFFCPKTFCAILGILFRLFKLPPPPPPKVLLPIIHLPHSKCLVRIHSYSAIDVFLLNSSILNHGCYLFSFVVCCKKTKNGILYKLGITWKKTSRSRAPPCSYLFHCCHYPLCTVARAEGLMKKVGYSNVRTSVSVTTNNIII